MGDRRLLLVQPDDGPGAEAAIARILEDLAELALAAWPAWPAPVEVSLTLAPWRRAADRLAEAGRLPLFRSVAGDIQFAALHPAAGAPILAVPIDPTRPEQAAPLVATLEWCTSRGAVTVALLPEPPWDRILHGAIRVEAPPPAPALARLVPPVAKGPAGSVVERRMRTALATDPDLAGLFANGVTLRLGPLGPTPRVDLLWAPARWWWNSTAPSTHATRPTPPTPSRLRAARRRLSGVASHQRRSQARPRALAGQGAAVVDLRRGQA